MVSQRGKISPAPKSPMLTSSQVPQAPLTKCSNFMAEFLRLVRGTVLYACGRPIDIFESLFSQCALCTFPQLSLSHSLAEA